ncbi:MAG TPA: HDOD domain-containing protein [Acidobacteriaceae bacterium]|jgi:HD-like signal output (HDOD) protein
MKRILFVDDEPNVLDGVRRMLHSTRDRWELEFVKSGQDALAACHEREFDAVVSDLRMPGMDGADLLAQIRTRFPTTARLILSGYSDLTLTARAVPVAYRVLPKPCGPKDLKEALERVFTQQDVLRTPALQEVAARLGRLPSLSLTYEALDRALLDPFVCVARIARIIERDAAMSASILRLVNSGLFGLAARATNFEGVLNCLGLDTIRSLALYVETSHLFQPGRGVPDNFCQAVRERSHRAARIASVLPLNRSMKEDTVVAVLLQDLGMLALAASMPDELCSILARVSEQDIPMMLVEEEILGVSHAEIGAHLLNLWGINNTVVEAVAHHHRPARIKHERPDCSSAIYLARLLEESLGNNPDDTNGDHLPEPDRLQLTALNMQDDFVRFHSLAKRALQAGETQKMSHLQDSREVTEKTVFFEKKAMSISSTSGTP